MSYFPFKNMMIFAIPVIIQIAVIIGVIFLLRSIVRKNNQVADGSVGGSRNALRILDERFARGEIDEAEYIRKKDMLKRH